MNRSDRYRAQHRAAGLCIHCPQPALPGMTTCDGCREGTGAPKLRWSAEDEATAIIMRNSGAKATTIASTIGRTVRSVRSFFARQTQQGKTNGQGTRNRRHIRVAR